MKLYTQRAACSLASHIIVYELGLDVEIVRVDRATHRTSDGEDFLAINPNGYVPALVLDDGEILLEGTAILQYLARLNPQAGLVPEDGEGMRHVQSLLNFIATELHKPMAQMMIPDYAPVKQALYKHVAPRLAWIAGRLTGDYVLDGKFSVADAYLFVCLNWSQWNGIDLSRWPKLEAFMQRVSRRPAVRLALEAEGLAPRAEGVFFAPALAA
ncbi:glutathione S-transferase N-terminal domain-containing protein [Taklimakanibacter lacteus]|uniref:glutathione S-transferase N-terminal domain-containing protein n=1 Tax=Taklimakanibacter lacteus TaxID=2268456 RepID=UPI000E6764B6